LFRRSHPEQAREEAASCKAGKGTGSAESGGTQCVLLENQRGKGAIGMFGNNIKKVERLTSKKKSEALLKYLTNKDMQVRIAAVLGLGASAVIPLSTI
jgi:hypothetical protein